jgi:prepilin-type processing-associated H-X9-DG protein
MNGAIQATGANTLFQDGHVGWKPLRTLTPFAWDNTSSSLGIDGTRYEWYYDSLSANANN